MIVPAPMQRLPDGRVRLDVKFVEGMRAHLALWAGTITVAIREGGAIPFGADYATGDLGFDLLVLPPGGLPADLGAGFDGIFASADMAETLDLASGAVPVVYSVEYTLGTRLRIVALDRSLNPLRKARSMLWNLMTERRRRAAFGRAAGLQCNGYPAMAAYEGKSRAPLLYLDGRMRAAMIAEEAGLAARAAIGGPLRIVHSGRLEPMKGGQDLLPVARALVAAGVDFTLDIFGAGSLEAELRAGAAMMDGRLRLHAPVDFETGLVPWMQANADLFLSCHRQADPSCTYLESLGCGVPVAGYANAMWADLARHSGGGWVVPMGDTAALAGCIAGLARDRARLAQAAGAGLSFARAHDFEGEFSARMRHLADCLAAPHGGQRAQV